VNYTQERKVEASVFGAAYNNAALSFLIAEFKRTDYSLDMALWPTNLAHNQWMWPLPFAPCTRRA
jgi:hypothetical protein